MLDWFHCTVAPPHADAAVKALQDAGAVSVFCYGAGWATGDDVEAEIRRVHALLPDGDADVTLEWGLRGLDDTTPDILRAELDVAAELGVRTSLHIASDGIARPIADLAEYGLLRDTTTYVHNNGVSAEELRLLAEFGASASVSPDVELKMGFGMPKTGDLIAAGIRPTLSVDDVPSVGGDMFSTMRTALATQRGIDGTLTSRDVLEFGTIDAARSLGIETRAGSLTPGKRADVVLLRADDPTMVPVSDPVGSIVSAGHPGLVDTVLVGGRVVKRDGRLVGVDFTALSKRLRESRDRVAAAAGVAVDGTWRPLADD